MEHTIELKYGYQDKKGKVHTSVTFGKRPKLGDIIALDLNPQAQSTTQHECLIRRLMITQFGDLKTPVDLDVLLSLDSLDYDRLSGEADRFLEISREGRTSEFLENGARLALGITIDGETYDVVHFGTRLKVRDYVEAEKLQYGQGVAREAHKAGCQISQLASSEHKGTRDGTLTVEQLSEMDGEDFNVLRLAAEFFRLGLTDQADEAKSTDADESGAGDSTGDGLEREGDPGDAARAA